MDSSGSAYVTGYTQSTNFPTTSGAFQTLYGGGGNNAFITKLNPTGSTLLYSTYLGGSNDDQGNGIAVDSSGSAYVTGYTQSTNFPTTMGAFQTLYGGTFDAFIAKLNSTGSGLVYSTYLGGNNDDRGQGIAVDSSGSTYITGYTQSTNFPTTSGAFQTLYGGGFNNAFITKLDPAGSALLYSTYLGSSGDDQGLDIVVDSSGSAYVTGLTASTNFPTTSGAFQTLYGGGIFDVFITKLNSTGTALLYSTYLGGGGNDQGMGIALDSSGNAYATGFTNSVNFPTTSGAFQTSYGGGFIDAFIAKLAIGSPVITSISPNCGPISGGTVVTITGLNFTDPASVNFGGVPALSIMVDSGTQITALSPPHSAGTVDIIVETSTGASSPSIIDAFTYVDLPAVSSISPTCGQTSGGTAVTITGSNFTGATTVNFGAIPAASFSVDSDMQITATSPSHAAGTVDITVTTPCGGTSAVSASDEFTYLPILTVISINPTQGPQNGGTQVAITGTNFTGATAVFFGSAAAAFVINSDTQITAVSPPHAPGIVDVTVQNLCGTSAPSSAGQFTYQVISQQLIPTTTLLTVSPNPAKRNQVVTLTASISSSLAAGSVVFYGNNKLLGVAPVVNGQAILTTSFPEHGELFIIAAYSGDNTFEGSVSNVIILHVGNSKDLQPPRKLIGFKKRQGFHVVNILEWNAPENHHAIVAYHIFRDRLDNQIGTLTNLQHLQFKDDHMKAGKTYTYYVVSVDEEGAISEPAQVVISGIEK